MILMDMKWDLELKVEVEDKPKLNTKLITGLLIEQESKRLSGLSLDKKVEYIKDLFLYKQKELIPIEYAKALIGDDFSSMIEQGKLSISTELDDFVMLEPLCKYLLVSKICSILDSSTSSEPSVIVKFKPQEIEIVQPQPRESISETMPEVATEPEEELTLSPSMSLMQKIKYVNSLIKEKGSGHKTYIIPKEKANILVDGKVDELIEQKMLKVPSEKPGYISVRSLNTYLIIKFGQEAKKAEVEEELFSEQLSEPEKGSCYKLVGRNIIGGKEEAVGYFDADLPKIDETRSKAYNLIEIKREMEKEGLLNYIKDLKEKGFNGEVIVDLRLPCVFDSRREHLSSQKELLEDTFIDLISIKNPFTPKSNEYKAVERFKNYMQIIEKLYEAEQI